MWHPKTWTEIESLIGVVEESPTLEFKQEIPENRKLAKEIAALSVDGGIVLIGVAEDKSAKASHISAVPLNGLEEKIRQVAYSRISPPPPIELTPIPNPSDESSGVMVISVPASPSAPHYTDERFYRRHGTTVEKLSEPEVDRLYRTRRHSDGGDFSLEDVVSEPADVLFGIGQYNADYVPDGVGLIQVGARMRGESRHSKDPWLRDPLKASIERTKVWCDAHNIRAPRFLGIAEKRGWQTGGIGGWYSGGQSTEEILRSEFRSSLALAYPSHLYLRFTVPLRKGGQTETIDYPCAYELEVVSELLGFLQWAGEWFGEYPTSGRVQIALKLLGFKDAQSYDATQARPKMGQKTPMASPSIRTAFEQSSVDLRESPEVAAHTLIDRWLATFYEGSDLVDHFASERAAGART